MDDAAPATAETIIHALSQFHDHPEHTDHDDEGLESTIVDLEGLSRRQLEEEVLRLRGMVHGPEDAVTDQHSNVAGPSRTVKQPRRARSETGLLLQPNTGKRVEKSRRTELYKAIRACMRSTMGMVNETDPLPAPTPRKDSIGEGEEIRWKVPDWLAPNSPAVSIWVEGVARQVSRDLNSGDENPYPKVGHEDRDYMTVLDATKVTLANYVKRYKSENDALHAERKNKYARKRRRWARKDLKQQRRAKASASLGPEGQANEMEAMHFDYMSSEHSSPGSDSSDEDVEWHEEKVQRRREIWKSTRQPASMPEEAGVATGATISEGGESGHNKEYGWAAGLASKALEVRTPSWRSSQVNDLYARLDAISTSLSESRNTPKSTTTSQHVYNIKLGHVAPSHRRFTLPPNLRRKGSLPRSAGGSAVGRKRRRGKGRVDEHVSAAGEGDAVGANRLGWMWASGIEGVWLGKTTET